jgi:hypothetical protein
VCSFEEPVAMNLRCVFHVSPTVTATPKRDAAQRQRMPSVVDTDASDDRPRGRSFETWSRARGWAS